VVRNCGRQTGILVRQRLENGHIPMVYADEELVISLADCDLVKERSLIIDRSLRLGDAYKNFFHHVSWGVQLFR
jgi:hypothetical protein